MIKLSFGDGVNQTALTKTERGSVKETFQHEEPIRKIVRRESANYINALKLDFVDAAGILGLNVLNKSTLKGRSGVVHTFTVVSKFDDLKGPQQLLAIDISQDNDCVGMDAVLSLDARSRECGVKNRVLVAIPCLDDNARILARSCNVPYVEVGESIEKGVKELQFVIMRLKELAINKTEKGGARGNGPNGRRGTHDIMVDILEIVKVRSSKAQIMASANLSYNQCQKYIPVMEKLGLLAKILEDGVHVRYAISEKGREYLLTMSSRYGRIPEGAKSIWPTRRNSKPVSRPLE